MNYEKLGAFYLGKIYDMAAGKALPELLLYDSKDLVTHAACFGMTGSGKTGLCTVLLEEAAIDGVPAIIIDPKGDLGNLLLNFPELRGEDFAPWIPEGAAQQKGMTPAEYAQQQADLWRRGLAEWDQDGRRIARLRESADFTIYTPGSEAGVPVTMLKSFEAPPDTGEAEMLREQVQSTVTSLLGMLGLDADPVRSRDHILLSLIFDHAWREGKSLDLPGLILQVQKPPVERVGVFDLDAFYPAKDRFQLAMTLNNVLASPGFASWLAGEPLDIGRMLYTAAGRPRMSVFSIAHLSDAERMFFVATLLHRVVGWMRSQAGATSLRALLYMDEIAGYLPPVANPPSKPPLMTLLKQARAFGVGVVLATQNPMDIDYKAMSNMGTWFVGRLQTDRDQARVLDGLAGAVAGSGREFDRAAMERTLAGLGKRVFLLYNVHEEGPATFQTRWALSYLPGPLTREQIRRLTSERGAQPAVASMAQAAAGGSASRPVVGPGIAEYFAPLRGAPPRGASLVYEPALAGFAEIHYSDARLQCDCVQEHGRWTPIDSGAAGVDWDEGQEFAVAPGDLESEPRAGAEFASLPGEAARPRNYAAWSRRFAQWIYTSQRLPLWRSPSLKVVSQPGETERDFRIRLEMAAREERDRLVETLRKRYEPKMRQLAERIRRAEAAVEKEKEQARYEALQSTVSLGATVLGALFGRKVASRTNVSRAGGAIRTIGRARKESQDVGRAKENVEALREQLAALEAEFEQDTSQVAGMVDPRAEEFEQVEVKPKKTGITVKLVALVWLPFWKDARQNREPAW